MEIGKAIKALKEGKRIRREMWPLEKRFIFRQVPAEINESIVPKMQSLPQSVKDFFNWTFTEARNEQIDAIYYQDHVALVGPTNTIINYAFQAEDVLAEDWVIL